MKSLLSIYAEVELKSQVMSVSVEIFRVRAEREDSRCSSLYPTFPPDLHMNGSLCSDIFSRLPIEGTLIMSCVIFCAAGGCMQGEGGRGGNGG